MVQPGVSARGKKYKTTVFPRRSFVETSLPFSSCKVKSGALSWIFMGVFLSEKSASARQSPKERASRRRRRKSILYRALATCGIFVVLISTCALVVAQEEMPEIKPQEKRFNNKKDHGPRAVALMQLAANGKATLVPIAIRIDGKFYDAAEYKANPVPMALDSGTVYEVERSGKSLGLFTVSAALHSNSISAVTPWIGTGLWLPEGTEAPKAGRKAETVPVGIESSDAPPRLSKSGNDKTAPPESPAPTTQTPPAKSTPESKPSGESKPSTANQTPSDSGAKAEAKPADRTASTESTNSSTNENNRPRLRRGKPTQPLPSDDDVPGYSKPGSPASGPTKTAEVSATKSGAGVADAATQIIPAVSDADGPNPRSYAFEWIKGEEADRRKQLLDLAREQLRLYLAKQAKAGTTATQAGPKAVPRRAPPKAPEPVLDNVDMRTFDLWANNQPIMVLTAEAHVPATLAKNTSESAPESLTQYMVTLVARTDIYDNLHKLHSGVTDKYHLDVTPRLELIDAVDADGDGRGELLFRETSDAGSGYVIYRATADTLWKMFDSLNPE